MAKKKGKKAGVMAVPAGVQSVNIRQADNGYVVSAYGDKGEINHIATSEKAALKAALGILPGMKKKK